MIVDGSFSIRVETEADILLVAELLQRRNGKAPAAPVKRERKQATIRAPKVANGKALTQTEEKVTSLLREHYHGVFTTKQANNLALKKLGLKRSTVGSVLRRLVLLGILTKLGRAKFSFESSKTIREDPRPNEDLLLDLTLASADPVLEISRIAKALSNEIPFVFADGGAYCRMSDGHGQIMLDMSLERSLFAGYHAKKSIEIKVDAAALYSRIERLTGALHLSLKRADSPLLIGSYELRVGSYRDFDDKVVQPDDIRARSELLIDRATLEGILSANVVNSPHIDIISDKDHIAFESHSEQGDYKPDPIVAGYSCIEPSRSRLHYQDTLIRCLKTAKCEQVKMRIGSSFLQIQFLEEAALKISLYLATKKEEVVMNSAM